MTELDLRQRLRDETAGMAVRLDAQEMWRDARRRSRRRTVLTLAVVGTVVVCGGVAAGVALVAGRPGDGPPATAPTSAPTTSAPPHATQRQSVPHWAASLIRGAPPEVPYLVGTTVHLPGGIAVDLAATEGASDVGIVGRTVAGLVVLIEEDKPGEGFTSRYVLIGDDGATSDMPISSQTGGAQGALVSPDGRYFTHGGPVIDKQTGEFVGQMPEAARVLDAWTPSGITYLARGNRYFLWRPGEAPIALDGNPGAYPDGTDIGIRASDDGCTEVVEIHPEGAVTPVSGRCFHGLLTVSPEGSRVVTADLRVLDVATGQARQLADPPLSSEIYSFEDVTWVDDTEFLLPVPVGTDGARARVVRCNTTTVRCEAATGSFDVEDYRTVELP